jgi:REP element-mobilizing transposase RayT
MPDYRRYRMPGGTYFFTVNLLERRLDTLVRHIDVLREAVRKTRKERPFYLKLLYKQMTGMATMSCKRMAMYTKIS